MAGAGTMKLSFGLPPWLKRTSGAAGAEYEPQAAAALELVEPTEEEARNGWRCASLTAVGDCLLLTMHLLCRMSGRSDQRIR